MFPTRIRVPADALQFIQNSSAASRPSSPPLPVITSPAEVSLYVTSLLVTVNPLPVGVGSSSSMMAPSLSR